MALKLRPTGLGSGIDKDRPDYTVYSGGWAWGASTRQRGGPDSLRWFWSLSRHLRQAADIARRPRANARRRPRRSSRSIGGAGWRGRSCVRTRSSYAATATLGGPTPGRL